MLLGCTIKARKELFYRESNFHHGVPQQEEEKNSVRNSF